MRLLRRWGPVFIWMAIIFAFSQRQRVSVSQQEVLNFLFFKTLHVLEYAMLYILAYRAMKLSTITGAKNFWAITSFIIVILFAMTDEMHQLFVPTREGRLRDVIIDTLGATIAWILITQLLPKTPKRLQHWAKSLLSI